MEASFHKLARDATDYNFTAATRIASSPEDFADARGSCLREGCRDRRSGKCDGHDGRQHKKDQRALSTLAIPDQEVAGNRHQGHQRPCAGGDPVPPGGLRITLRVDDVVHAGDGQRHDRSRLPGRCRKHRRPKLVLKFGRTLIDILRDVPVGFFIEGDPESRYCRKRSRVRAPRSSGRRSARKYSVPIALASASSRFLR